MVTSSAAAARVSCVHACNAARPPVARSPRATDQLYLATRATVSGLRLMAVSSIGWSLSRLSMKVRDAELLDVRIVGLLNSYRSRNAGMRLHIDTGTPATVELAAPKYHR